jgi:hypothetical protein
MQLRLPAASVRLGGNKLMRKIVIALVVVMCAGMGAGISKSSAADQPSPQAGSSGSPAPAAPGEGAGAACCKAGDNTPPLDLIKNTTKGQLHSPYNDKIAEMADEGHKKYMAAGCNGCHGWWWRWHGTTAY